MPGPSLRLPKCLQNASRTLQDDSSWPQDASRTLQNPPKMRPRSNSEAKTLPTHCQDPPELGFWRFWEAFGNVFLFPALTTFRKCVTKFRSKVPLSKCRSHYVRKFSSTDDGGLRVAVSIRGGPWPYVCWMECRMDLEWKFSKPDRGTRRPPPQIISVLFGGSWGHVGLFFAIFHIFFSHFFGFLSHHGNFYRFSSGFHRFPSDFGRIWGGFFNDFLKNFQIFFKGADLQNSCAHAVFRRGRALKN